MKAVLMLMIIALLVLGCAKPQEPVPEPKQIETRASEPRIYEMVIMSNYEKPLLGEGRVFKPRLIPENLELKVGDTVMIENRDLDEENIRIIQLRKDVQTKFRDILRQRVAKGQTVEYTFESEGTFKVLCQFNGCLGLIDVESRE